MVTTSKTSPVTPWVVLGAVSLVATVPAWLKFSSSKAPFFSFHKSAIPLKISALGILVATGGLVKARQKRIVFEISLFFTKANNWAMGYNWWDSIEGHPSLLVGGMPLKDKGHLAALQGAGVGAVLSMVEAEEQEAGWINTPVTLQDFQGVGMVAKRIEAKDYLPVTQEQIKEGVAFLKEQIAAGKTVYVHCKAGRGRSVTIVVCYLLEKNPDALALVKRSRPRMHLNVGQLGAIQLYVGSLKR